MSSTTPPGTSNAQDGRQKGQIRHVEDDADSVNVLSNCNAESIGSNWTFWQTVGHYWRAMAICFACGICAMGDGYQYKMPGNIVALEGFIRQMGSFDEEEKKWGLDSQQVAAWGGQSCIISSYHTGSRLTERSSRICCRPRFYSPHWQLAR